MCNIKGCFVTDGHVHMLAEDNSLCDECEQPFVVGEKIIVIDNDDFQAHEFHRFEEV